MRSESSRPGQLINGPGSVSCSQSPPTAYVAVILSELNSQRTLRRCLDCLESQDFPTDRYEIVVVDGGSTDGTLDIIKQRPPSNLRLIPAQGASEAAGQSMGVAHTTAEIVIFTNSDIYVPRDWISRHVSRLSEGYDMVGGSIFWGGDKFSFTWNQVVPEKAGTIAEGSVGLGFSNFSVRRSEFLKHGGLKDLSSQQDTEFALRATSHGAKLILDPGIEVYHDHPLGSLKRSFERSYAYAANHVVMDRLYSDQFGSRAKPWGAFRASLLQEALLINGIRAYRQRRGEAEKHGIRMGLVEFLGARLVGRGFGHVLGLAAGYFKPLRGAHITINTHSQGNG